MASRITGKAAAVDPNRHDSRFVQQRTQLVDGLRRRGINDECVLRALRQIPRHELMPERTWPMAYVDAACEIGWGQTISQPLIVGLMTQALAPRSTDRVLEIGTGSGYQAAVLSRIVADVYTIEIVPHLARKSTEDLARLGLTNIHVREGDGSAGWPDAAPFDAVIVTCAPEHIPPALVEQLRDGGRMTIPVGPRDGEQLLFTFRKEGGRMVEEGRLPVLFVPMTGEAGTTGKLR